MNSLSWFLYLADVFHSIGTIVATIGLVGLIVGIPASVFVYLELRLRWPILIPAISFLMLFAAALLPSKQTMYAIAASELGEQAAKSELGQKGMKAIEAWIDEQLKGKK